MIGEGKVLVRRPESLKGFQVEHDVIVGGDNTESLSQAIRCHDRFPVLRVDLQR